MPSSSALLKLNLHAASNGHPKFKVKVQIPDPHKYGVWQTIGNLSMSRSEFRVLVAMIMPGARITQRIFTCTGDEGEAALKLAELARVQRKERRPDVSTTRHEEPELNPPDETPNERREREAGRAIKPVEPHKAEYYEFLYGKGRGK